MGKPLTIASLEIGFFLPGCASLKEKRQRLRRLADVFGKKAYMAVAETGCQDTWQNSLWTFVIIAPSQAQLDSNCAAIENYCRGLDAIITTVNLVRLQ